MKKIYILSGKQGSGKSTLAAALFNKLAVKGVTYPAIYKFADPLYHMHEYILNYMERTTGKPRAAKDGKLLQVLGTEWGRKVLGDNVWVEALKTRVENAPHDTIIIDDCRFPNELAAFPNAVKIRLKAPAEIRRYRTTGWREDQLHMSEIALDAYDKDFDITLDTSKLSVEECLDLITTYKGN